MLPYRRPRKPRARRLDSHGPSPPRHSDPVPETPPEAGPRDPEPKEANGPFARLSLGGLGLLILLLMATLIWYGHRNGHPSGACLGTGTCLAHPRNPSPGS